MDKLTLFQWIEITAQSAMPLYAVLTNTGDSQVVKRYYQLDGSQTPYGLYTGTPYAEWFEVMPMIVPLADNSSFLDWVATTEQRDWGWLARSPFPFAMITDYLKGLIQVIMPDNSEVFFRYWDGEYLAYHLRFLDEEWAKVLPAFPFYWINGEDFSLNIRTDITPQDSPWWRVPEALLNGMIVENTQPVIDSTLLILKEQYPDIYWRYPLPILKVKLNRLLQLLDYNYQQLVSEVVKELEGMVQ